MNARRRIQRRQRTMNSNSAHVAHLKRKKSMLSRRARGVVLYMYVSRRNRRTRARWNRIDDTVQLFTRRISRAIRARWLFFFDVCHAVGERYNIDCNVTKQPHVEPSAYLETLVSPDIGIVCRTACGLTDLHVYRTDTCLNL